MESLCYEVTEKAGEGILLLLPMTVPWNFILFNQNNLMKEIRKIEGHSLQV